MRRLTLAPLADGWRLSVDNIQNDMVFASGAAAEAAARHLAFRLSQAGTPAEIWIYLRDHSLGGRFVCPAAWPDRKVADTRVAAPVLAGLPEAA
jgi:hypothetical protein